MSFFRINPKSPILKNLIYLKSQKLTVNNYNKPKLKILIREDSYIGS